MNELLLNGVALDLSPDTHILPSFQTSDLLQPDKIQSDFSPEFSVPGTQRNHAQLGQAAYDGSGARVPYKSISGVTLRSEGVDIMPRARLFLKGFEAGSYQLQLFAGNRRFVEALGEKTLQDLDFSRFTHLWTIGAIADRAAAGYWQANGWGYELYDRGKPVLFSQVPAFDLYPTLSARLIWEQLLLEAGFTASDWQSELLDKLQVPSVHMATLPEAYREARRLRVGLGPGHEESGAPSSGRADVVRTIPFDDDIRPIGNVAPLLPSVPGVYSKGNYSYTADKAQYVQTLARTVVRFDYSTIRLGQAQARVQLHVNGKPVVVGENLPSKTQDPYSVAATAERLLLQKGDVLTAVLVLSGVGSAPIDKWGYTIFADQVYNQDGVSIPVDKFEVTVLEELAPGGEVNLSAWLPAIKLLDFFKTLVQLGGLSVRCDSYQDHLHLWPSSDLLDNASQAVDWTRKRDTPSAPAGQPRSVAYRYGSFGQRNSFRYAQDDTVPEGTGNGVLLIDDESLPLSYEMLTLPFAASEPSGSVPGLLRIPAYKLRDNEDPFAEPAYDSLTVKPRLTLSTGRTLSLTLVDGTQQRTVAVPVSHFAEAGQPVSLDAEAYVLPRNWRGLRAMLTDCRYHKERYRLTAADIARYLAAPQYPIWDAVLGGYFSIVRISEFSAERPTEVELLRLHPASLGAPAAPRVIGREFYEEEFAVLPPTQEAY